MNHDEDCECRECIPHEEDCRCWECYEQRVIEADRARGDYIWAREQAAAERADDLMGGALSEEEK